MTTFEWASIGYYAAQLGIIAWGIWEMRKNNASREASNTLMLQQAKALEDMSKGLEDMGKGLKDMGKGLEDMGAGIRELLRRSA